MEKKEVIVTGASGLVGSKFISMFTDNYSFVNLDLSDPVNPVDITNPSQVLKALENSTAQFVVHFAAYTDVTGAWKQNNDTTGSAYSINVGGTKNVVEACKKTGKHLIHISTAYVFDGNKPELYTEADPMNPIEWYGKTKALAEELITTSEIDWTILRIDQPFRSDTQIRPDVVRRIANGLQTNTLYPQFTNHFFGPTFIDDFARVIDCIIRTQTPGLFHASSGEQWTDFDFACLIQETLALPGTVKAGDLDEYLKTLERAYQRNTALDVTKLQNILDFELTPIAAALKQVVL